MPAPHDAAPPPFDPADMPHTVRLLADGGGLAVDWSDDVATRQIPAATLRGACRCAWCSRARIDGAPPLPATGIAVTEVHALGRHAVHLIFSDGHRKGVFPWTYVRALVRATASEAAA